MLGLIMAVPPAAMSVADTTLGAELSANLQTLYVAGRFKEAAELLPAARQLPRLTPTHDLILAGRIMNHVGGWRQGRGLMNLAWRRAPRNLDAAAYAAFSIPRRSLWDTWQWIRTSTNWEPATADAESHWLTVKARSAAYLRDFTEAEKALQEADERTPHHPWVAATRAEVLELTDEYESALEWTAEALRLHPENVPARARRAHLLTLLNRDDEALALLRESCARFNSISYPLALINLLIELKLEDEALAVLDQLAVYDPWLDRVGRQWQSERRADLLSFRGDVPGALAHAAGSKNKYYQKLRENLQQAPADGRRVELPVPFVRQKHVTCVPATLCALAQFWRRPIRQEEISNEICYDGTPHSAERGWAEKHGWHVREFTLTWDSARALIDRGVPFALTTTFTQSGHMQAVVGYDSRRQTLVVRDPHQRPLNDWMAEGSLKEHSAHGPRALILLPPGELSRLQDVLLPDTALWDGLYRVHSALLAHRRDEAAAEGVRLAAAAPGHLLTLRAQLAVADYDRHKIRSLEVVGQLLQMHPADGQYRLRRIWLLRQLNRHKEAREVLDAYVQDGDTNPAWLQQQAEEMLNDHRLLAEVASLRRRLLRSGPYNAEHYVLAGREAWLSRQPDQAVELYRAAACLGNLREDFAATYFSAARCRRLGETALALLQRRDEAERARSRAPLLTRLRALREFNRIPEARALLDSALAAYPDDGNVLLEAAEQAAQRGDFAGAQRLLEQAHGRVLEIQWLQLSARLCEMQGDLPGSIQRVTMGLEQSPDNEDLLRQLAGLVARHDTSQRAAAVVGEWVARQPHHYGFRAIHLEWLRYANESGLGEAIREFAVQNPGNGWLEREWVLYHLSQQNWTEAHAHLRTVLALEPNFPFNHFLEAQVRLREGDRVGARTAALAAVRLSVDGSNAIDLLLDACDSPGEQRQMLQIVLEEIARQVNLGDGILACGPHVTRLLPRPEQKQVWETLHRERPDLWQCWSLLIAYHLQINELDTALQLAVEAEETFPLQGRPYWDRYLVHKARGERPEQKATLERAVAAYPRWGAAERELAFHLREYGDLAGCRTVLQRAIFHNPLDFLNHGYLVEVDLQEQRLDAALAGLERSLQLEPHYPWGLQSLLRLRNQAGQFPAALAFLRAERDRRPGYFWPLLNLANAFAWKGFWPECLETVGQALAVSPLQVDAVELQMRVLYHLGRVPEALALVANPKLSFEAQSQLRSRAAQIEIQRGDKLRAVELLRAALKDDEGNAEAWRKLAECLVDLQQWKDALPATVRYVELEPHVALSHGLHGWVLLKLDQKPPAQAALETALKLDHGYQFAAYRLLRLHLTSGIPLLAENLVAQLRRHPGGDFALRCEVELHAARHRTDEAWVAMAALAATPLTVTGEFESAWKALLEATTTTKAKLQLYVKLRLLLESTPGAKAISGQVLAELSRSVGKVGSLLRWAAKRPESSPAVMDALRRGIEVAAEAKQRWLIYWLVLRRRPMLCASDELWGTVGYAFYKLGHVTGICWWMKDWAQRTGVKPWMINNLLLAECRKGHWATVQGLVDRALALDPDQIMKHSLTFAGFVVEDAPAARTLLQRYPVEPEDPKVKYYQLMRRLATIRLRLIAEAPLDRATRRTLFREYRGCLHEAHLAKIKVFQPARRVVSALAAAETRPYKRALILLRGTFRALF